jgi:AMP phosphorylase
MVKKYNRFVQLMKAKPLDIYAKKFVAIITEIDAKQLGVFPLDRIGLVNTRNKKCITAIVDVTTTMFKENEIGLFKDVADFIGAKPNDKLEVMAVSQPDSVKLIKKKMRGETLTEQEIKQIVDDIAQNKLTEIDASAFITATYINGYSLEETVAMTKALVDDGNKLKIKKSPILDKHSIGGLNGRATIILVPIIAAAGCYIPKTSSRSITSAAGTADSMECLANVSLSVEQIKRITEKIGGVITWGGAVELAPADDKIIKIEHPLSLDPEGQVIASVMAKKASVGAEYLIIDLPVGPEVKVATKEKAEAMAKKFIEVGKHLGIKTEVLLTDGEEPCGNNFGAMLEAKEAMLVLEGKVFNSLAQKSCELAGALLELAGKAKKGTGYETTKEILQSGKALKKMKEIIKAQGARALSSADLKEAKLKQKVLSETDGEVTKINVRKLIMIARTAGAPADQKAGLVLLVEHNQKIRKGTPLFEIHAENKQKLELAIDLAKKDGAIELQKIIIEKIV